MENTLRIYHQPGTDIFTYVEWDGDEEYISKMVMRDKVLINPKEKVRGKELMLQLERARQFTDDEVVKRLLVE